MRAADLVVAGAGGGLAGALRAAELGLRVLVVEANADFRRANNTSMTTGMIPGAGTRWQAAAGIDDSPEWFLADVMAKTRGQADPRLARALTQVSGDLVTWLADGPGVPLTLETDFNYPGHAVHRCHTVPGRTGAVIVDHLADRAAAAAGIELLVPARLEDVRADGDGAVTAAVIRTPDGDRADVPCGAVLLATSGFGAAAELVAEHLPTIAGATYHGSREARGDALRIGRGLGAASAFMDAYQGHAALSPVSGTLVGWAAIMHGAVMVNARGVRFDDETRGYSEYAESLAAQPGMDGWIVLDRRIHDACQSFPGFRATAEAGALTWRDDPAALAAAIGVEPAALTATITAAEAAACGERADPAGRSDWEAPLEPPYAAVRVTPALFHTQGGLVVDEHARVLRGNGSPISGLYAAGGAAMGISGHGARGYLAGNGLLPALGLAYLAANGHAARRFAGSG